ncbi:MAG: LysE family translocator [Aquabacterium sp.]
MTRLLPRRRFTRNWPPSRGVLSWRRSEGGFKSENGALHGKREALNTIMGGVAGFLLVMAMSMFGIGALLQSSLAWLTLLKWVGGLYLVYLGVQVWRSRCHWRGAAAARMRPVPR